MSFDQRFMFLFIYVLETRSERRELRKRKKWKENESSFVAVSIKLFLQLAWLESAVGIVKSGAWEGGREGGAPAGPVTFRLWVPPVHPSSNAVNAFHSKLVSDTRGGGRRWVGLYFFASSSPSLIWAPIKEELQKINTVLESNIRCRILIMARLYNLRTSITDMFEIKYKGKRMYSRYVHFSKIVIRLLVTALVFSPWGVNKTGKKPPSENPFLCGIWRPETHQSKNTKGNFFDTSL